MKYRLIAGNHVEGKKIYKKGDIIESHTDLVKVLQGKFEVVAGTDDFKLIDPPKQEKVEAPKKEETYKKPIRTRPPKKESLYEIEKVARGYYSVINKETGKAVNDKKLRKKVAEELLVSLGEEGAE